MINEKPENIFRPFNTNITSNTIDSYTTDGIYEAYFNNVGPGGGWGILIVATTGRLSIVEQVIICWSGIGHRHYESGAWSAWRTTTFS